MTAMIERVAQRMAATEFDPALWDESEEWFKDVWRTRARAAVEAMREPTPRMVAVVSANWGRRTWAEYNDVIDAALAETR